MENCTLLNTGHFRVLIPEKYESRIQLKESGIPLTIEIRNPSSTGKESEIQDLLIWTPEFRTMTGIQISDSLESSWKYLTLGEKKSDIHSLLKVHLDFGVVFGTNLIWISVPKEVTPVAFSEAPTASQSCAQISLWLMVKSAVGDLGTRLTYLFPRPLARGKQRAHVLSTLWVST